MKVIFFVTGLDSGGLENYLLRFLNYKFEDFNEIEIFCKGGFGGQLESQFLKLPNVKIIHKNISFINPLHYYNLYKYFKLKQFDSVCDFTGNFAGLILFISKLAGIKNRVVFYRGASNHFKETKFKKLYNKFVNFLTYKYATNILSNSQAAFKYFFTNKIDNRFQVIYNGIDSSDFNIDCQNIRESLNLTQNAFLVGHVGRFNSAKNHETILNVAKKIIISHPNIYFILCGNGVKINLEKSLEDNFKNNILLFENRKDIPNFLNSLDLFFFPSTTEGQPNALIEAMVMGIPFIASNIESIKETVDKVYYDRLIDPLDVNSFIAKIEQMYNEKVPKDYSLRNSTIEKFNHKILFDQFFNNL